MMNNTDNPLITNIKKNKIKTNNIIITKKITKNKMSNFKKVLLKNNSFR